ncbi:hypothetical protein CERSUDRAFT_97510 [Gelatoporia subvermispora B]|uniref:BTB domain-containing protein n=1 Tax=Ceriporiopsis subvermispora (strain B) TaxID=914234 RepID=M2R775_CERS8|nr:hypothetical protein CERSUDRAFT_97510 [Gelatoporia subvermispora B]
MDAGAAGTHWKRVKEFWFDDGNIILIAEDQGFRVYRGLLSRHSQVFRDMFCIPQPNAAETLDGCPIVRLSGDSPADLTRGLRHFYSSTLRDPHLPFAVIAAVIQIGHKYVMGSLQVQAITRLQSLFPTGYLFTTTIESHFSLVPVNATPLDAFTAVNLGRLTGQTSILPFAFDICAQYDNELVNGVTLNGRLNGSLRTISPDVLLPRSSSLKLEPPLLCDCSAGAMPTK